MINDIRYISLHAIAHKGIVIYVVDRGGFLYRRWCRLSSLRLTHPPASHTLNLASRRKPKSESLGHEVTLTHLLLTPRDETEGMV